jgi:hypothetical protein
VSAVNSTASAAHDPALPEGLLKHVSAESVAQKHSVPVSDVVSKAAAEGAKAVLGVMREHASDAEFQWWCCDALASLCAGNEENRAAVYVAGGVIQILAAMKVFGWDENVQDKANWALANMAASYADYVGKQGGVEAVVAGMRACSDSYQVQVSGARALQNLVGGSEANKVRAAQCGAEQQLLDTLERNPEDGQLQWRGQQLLVRLGSLTEKDMQRHMQNAEVARGSPWSRIRAEVFAGHAKRISAGQVPGLYGASAKVAAKAKEGLGPVLAFMRERKGYRDIETWCCDAISTMCGGNEELRKTAFEHGAVELIFGAMAHGTWEEELVLKSFWALLALAPSYPVEIGTGDNMSVIIAALYANKTAHQVQVAGIKLISLLTTEGESEERGEGGGHDFPPHTHRLSSPPPPPFFSPLSFPIPPRSLRCQPQGGPRRQRRPHHQGHHRGAHRGRDPAVPRRQPPRAPRARLHARHAQAGHDPLVLDARGGDGEPVQDERAVARHVRELLGPRDGPGRRHLPRGRGGVARGHQGGRRDGRGGGRRRARARRGGDEAAAWDGRERVRRVLDAEVVQRRLDPPNLSHIFPRALTPQAPPLPPRA